MGIKGVRPATSGSLEDISSKCKRGGGELAKGGGNRVDDVAEHLLEAGKVVGHRPELPVEHWAFHPVARTCCHHRHHCDYPGLSS